jgi:hypothetical protein
MDIKYYSKIVKSAQKFGGLPFVRCPNNQIKITSSKFQVIKCFLFIFVVLFYFIFLSTQSLTFYMKSPIINFQLSLSFAIIFLAVFVLQFMTFYKRVEYVNCFNAHSLFISEFCGSFYYIKYLDYI